ncbi:MAG: GYF domain-containing protein, partial [Pirellulaceae bacterium]|nr:GYF domain-containing protein [Pirellulaceae bacterium]
GPYPMEKLKQMVDRGQLSRIHQISEDGEIWRKASEVPELFEPRRRVEVYDPEPREPEPREPEPNRKEPPDPTTGKQWYVEKGGQPHGPLPFEALQASFARGEFSPNTKVWSDGMKDWVEAYTIPGLVNGGPGDDDEATSTGEIDDQVLSRLFDSRSWVITVAVLLVVWALLAFVGAFYTMVVGIKASDSPSVIGAMVQFLLVALMVVFAIMTFSYSSAIQAIKVTPDNSSLHFAMKKLNRLWVFSASYLAGLTVLIIIAVIIIITTTIVEL